MSISNLLEPMQKIEDQVMPLIAFPEDSINPEETSTGGKGRVNRERRIFKPNKLREWRKSVP